MRVLDTFVWDFVKEKVFNLQISSLDPLLIEFDYQSDQNEWLYNQNHPDRLSNKNSISIFHSPATAVTAAILPAPVWGSLSSGGFFI